MKNRRRDRIFPSLFSRRFHPLEGFCNCRRRTYESTPEEAAALCQRASPRRTSQEPRPRVRPRRRASPRAGRWPPLQPGRRAAPETAEASQRHSRATRWMAWTRTSSGYVVCTTTSVPRAAVRSAVGTTLPWADATPCKSVDEAASAAADRADRAAGRVADEVVGAR